jgi:putative MATE family efflux protein
MNENEMFATQPVGKLLVKLAIPSIMAQLVNMLYNIVDRIFLGHIEGDGALILAGLGVVVPVVYVVNAFASLIGTGGAPLVAIAMGKKRNKEAEQILGNSFILLVVLAIILTIVFQIMGEPILSLLGADKEILPYASKYLKIYAWGNIFVMLSLGLNPFLTTQGFNKISMINISIGAFSNILLDIVFIYCLNMGITGAAFATVISQGISAVLSLVFLLGKRTKIRLRYTKVDGGCVKNIIALGMASFFMGASEGLVQAVVYNQMLVYADSNYVAAATIMYTIAQFIFLISQGICEGAQPIISYNYGAGLYGRVKGTLRLVMIYGTLISILLVGAIELKPGIWISLFTNDKTVYQIAVFGLRIFVGGRALSGIQMGLQHFFRSVGDPKTSIFNAAVRKFVLLIPLAYILPMIANLGTTGVYLAGCIADLLAVAVSVGSYYVRRNKIFALE